MPLLPLSALTLAVLSALGGVAGLLTDNDLQAVGMFFTMVTAVVTAVLGQRAHSQAKSNKEGIEEVQKLVSAPRQISTTREDGVRIEPPDLPPPTQ